MTTLGRHRPFCVCGWCENGYQDDVVTRVPAIRLTPGQLASVAADCNARIKADRLLNEAAQD